MTKIIAFLTAVMALISLTAKKDDKTITEEDVVYKNSNVTVIRYEPLKIPDTIGVYWDMPTEDELYENCDIIADVTITSIEEVIISYTFMGTECNSYKTLANVSLNTVYYSADKNISEEFTVAIPNSSYSFDEDFPEIAPGKRCILFISDTKELSDSLELSNYCDYYLSSPAHIINIDGSECQASTVFSSYSDSSRPVISGLLEGEVLEEEVIEEIISDDTDGLGRCSMPLADFERTLRKKIAEKIKE